MLIMLMILLMVNMTDHDHNVDHEDDHDHNVDHEDDHDHHDTMIKITLNMTMT